MRQGELSATRTMLERTQDRLDLWPARLTADTAYGSAEMLNSLVHERGIEPHIPVFDKSVPPGRDLLPQRLRLRPRDRRLHLSGGQAAQAASEDYRAPRPLADENGMLRYRAGKFDCDACSLKPRCCSNAPARKVLRSIHEGARDMARDIAKTDVYRTSMRQRKKVEKLFAHLKRILRLDRLRLRGSNGAETSSSSPPPPRTFAGWPSWPLRLPQHQRESRLTPARPASAEIAAAPDLTS